MEFRPMRRKAQQLDAERARRLLVSHKSGVLAVLGDGGFPYAVPINYAAEEAGGRISVFFHSAKAGHKVDALAACDKASLAVVAKDELVPHEFTTHFVSVIAFGHVRVVADEAGRDHGLRLIAQACSADDPEGIEAELAKSASRTLLYEMEVEHLTGKQAIELARAERQEG